MLWKGLGFSPHQQVLDLSSGVPGIYDVPENDNSNFDMYVRAAMEAETASAATATWRPANPTNQLKRLQPSSKTGRGRGGYKGQGQGGRRGRGGYQGRGHHAPTVVYNGVHYHHHEDDNGP